MRSLKIVSALIIVSVTFSVTSGFTQKKDSELAISWSSMEEAQDKSAADGKALFVFVEAEWCGICKRMIQNVFPNQEVKEDLASNYHSVKIDLDSKNDIRFNGESMTEREFARKMDVSGTPTTIFFSSDGEELGRQVGFIGTDELNRLLAYIISDQFPDVPLKEFEPEG